MSQIEVRLRILAILLEILEVGIELLKAQVLRSEGVQKVFT